MPPLPRTAPREPDRIREVFLSATAKDVAAYRTGVQQALTLVNTAVFLQQQWAQPAAGVLDLCLNRLGQSDAYIGVFGYRYGWIPEGRSQSITELECDGALQLWGDRTVPPIFLFLPEVGSAAARELEAEAARILEEEYPADQTKRAESRQRQQAFCERLRNSGRFIGPFATVEDLRERAIASVANWNVEILAHAGEARAALADVPPSELGAIDRRPQREALENALVAVRASASPGMCVIVHGGEDTGQFAFLSFLESWPDWDISGTPRLITPPHDRFDAGSVLAAALAEILPGMAPATATPADLADAVVGRCRDESLVLFFSVDRLDGGLEGFHRGVWQPVLAEVAARRPPSSVWHPLVVVVSSSSPLRPPLPACVRSDDLAAGDVDYGQLLALPELTSFTQSDVAEWLRALGLPLDRRKQIARRATKDGVPRGVFDRLNTEGFWRTLTP
jgi:hypothetical protein